MTSTRFRIMCLCRGAGCLWALAAPACKPSPQELPPFGEALVEIDTNLAVPKTVGHIRIDLLTSSHRWLESRDLAALEPGDLPMSFSLYNDSPSEARSVIVRARAYPDGRERDYLGERFTPRPSFAEPTTYGSLAEACAHAIPLPLETATAARFRAAPFDDGRIVCGDAHTRSGLAAFVVDLPDAIQRRVQVVAAVPGHPWADVADTVMSIRADCADAGSEVACNDDASAGAGPLSAVDRSFAPGRYFILVGNVAAGPMDVTLYADPSDAASATPPNPGADTTAEERRPRLVIDGADVTPRAEPLPNLTVDRLALIRIEPARKSWVRLLLDGGLGDAACVDAEGTLVRLREEPVHAGVAHDMASRAGTWSGYDQRPCGGEPKRGGTELFDGQVCISGGAFTLGDPSVIGSEGDDGQPERVAVLPPFFMDRFEYSVARYRDARRRGFKPPDGGPLNNFDGVALDPDVATRACTWSEALDGSPLYPDQETLPLSCVSWYSARALCLLDGGDLPTVAEREYAASATGREFETLYPWGDDPKSGSVECEASGTGVGLAPVDAEPWASADMTPDGVVALGGSLAEWTLDSHRPYSDPCWQSQPMESPRCWEEQAPLRTLAGGSWRDPAGRTRSAERVAGAPAATDPSVGFRCVYPAPGGR